MGAIIGTGAGNHTGARFDNNHQCNRFDALGRRLWPVSQLAMVVALWRARLCGEQACPALGCVAALKPATVIFLMALGA